MSKAIIGTIGEFKELLVSFETNEFFMGEEVDCVIFTRNRPTLFVPDKADENVTSSFWVAVQFHGHATIGSETLVDSKMCLPATYRKLHNISIKNCGTVDDYPASLQHFVDHTGNRGCSIVYPRPVFERFDVTPSNDTDVCVEFKLILPELLPPSFAGTLIRYEYFLSFSVCEDTVNMGHKVKDYHIPIQVHFLPQKPPGYIVNKHGFLSISDKDVYKSIRNHEFGAAINLNFQNEIPEYDPRKELEPFGCMNLFSQHPADISNKAALNINHENTQIATISIIQDVQAPYGMIQINIEFNREIYICETTVVELQFVEQLMDFNDNNVSKSQAPNNDSKSRDSNLEKMDANKNVQHTTTVETHERDTMAFQNIFLDVQIPSYGLTFSTDLVDVLWFLRFQFTLKLRSELEALEKRRARAPKSQKVPSNESIEGHICQLQYPLDNYA
eukprot:g15458.t1